MVDDEIALHVRGHRWLLVEVRSGPDIVEIVPSLHEAWLDLSGDGAIGFSDGVNFHSGRFDLSPDGLVVTDIGSTLVGYVGDDPQIVTTINALRKLSEVGHRTDVAAEDSRRPTVRIGIATSLLELEITDMKLVFRRAGTLRE